MKPVPTSSEVGRPASVPVNSSSTVLPGTAISLGESGEYGAVAHSLGSVGTSATGTARAEAPATIVATLVRDAEAATTLCRPARDMSTLLDRRDIGTPHKVRTADRRLSARR